MAIVTMPALSPTMTEGKLSKWLVQEGDDVRSGDVIAEIETDKAVMEVEALDDGKITTIVIAEGTESVAVGTTIAEILGDGEDSALSSSPSPSPAKEAAPASAAPQVPDKPKEQANEAPVATPVAPSAKPSTVASSPVQPGERIFASPLARRIAEDRGIDLASLKGSGPRGRIIKADFENVGATVMASTPQAVMPMQASEESSVIEHTQMRKVIADRLQQSMQDSPHFYVNMDIDIGQMLTARKALNNHAPEGVKISVNDMIIKAAATALMRVPEVNASWEGTQTRRFHHADISVAVAIEGGLITPIIRHADEKGLEAISTEVAALAKKAHDSKLAPEEYTGGSFTISNLGMFGVTSFTAVINPPQAAILAIGAGEERAVVRNGQLAVATMMTATLSSDHRVIDGATAARFMKVFKDIVENPVLALA
jgi:pyruvate dehydrogenase E2 component (dihydrolipoamide acetyltransferase)